MSKNIDIDVIDSTSNINSNNPYVYISPTPLPAAPAKRPNPMNTIYGALNHYGKKVEEATKQAEIMVDKIRNHLKVSARPADAAMAKLIQGTKVLASGGPDNLFQQTFGVFPGEKLLQPYACYVSTNSGPVIGTLYVSTKRLAFCSDNPLCHHPFSLQKHQCIYYKVVVQLDQLSKVSSATNGLNPTEKCMKVKTTDGYEFIFLGFLSYDKTLQTVNEALKQ
ncbi:GEM-like protein 2 [Cajanus cajan]|uniref:GEM-like protein 2 n=1 Tax=Cajanus cajan TaxID=3821 RepID=A0A151S9B5_CAJCA|nr:GEM-like protein 2 [Cajanus cajan]KYP51358.1 GEM-like protein 2 [Cajanus cajan]